MIVSFMRAQFPFLHLPVPESLSLSLYLENGSIHDLRGQDEGEVGGGAPA